MLPSTSAPERIADEELERLRQMGTALKDAGVGGYFEVVPDESEAERSVAGTIFYTAVPKDTSLCVLGPNFLVPCNPMILKRLATGQERRHGNDTGWACSAIERRTIGGITILYGCELRAHLLVLSAFRKNL